MKPTGAMDCWPNRAGTYVGTFRAVAKNYPHKNRADILRDLVQLTRGEEGNWFAAAKDEGLFSEAIALARTSPTDPKTLARAARDLGAQRPEFAIDAGLLALYWFVQGSGYEVTGADVWTAYSSTMAAAQIKGNSAEVRERVCQVISADAPSGFVTKVLGRELGL